MFLSLVVFSSGGNLYAIAQRGARAGGSHLGALRERVDLHDRAVDLVPQRMALLLHARAERVHRLDVGELLDLRVHGEAETREPLERLVVRRELRAALLGAGLVAEERETPARGDGRVDLAQRARGGVARVCEESVVLLGLPAVELGERVERHEDLAAHLDHLGDLAALELLREVVDRDHVGGHVLADLAIAPGRTSDQAAAFVEQRDREPVELRFADVGDVLGHDASEPLAPRDEVVTRERVVERQHRLEVAHLRERGGDLRRAGTLRRRIVGDEVGVRRFERAQLAHERRRTRRR